ncbi:MAG TPA: YhjD/YihY/BrkB family envelope integrity protein [Verrucomicrobiae bacterium]|nr:YhjD/YihY/BrkB family envelope integrity protein [Verrucomicrobiae bacterium]
MKILSGAQTGAEHEFNRLERVAHFCVMVGKSFVQNRCLVRASALSYSTLLALIPLLAVAVSVTSSLLKTQGEQEIYQAIDKFVSNIMPPATLETNHHSVALNLSPISVQLTRTNSVANTNLTSTMASTEDSEGNERVVTAQKEAAKEIHNFVQNTQSGTLGVVGMLLLVVVAIRMIANIETTFNDIWGVTRGRNWLWRTVLYWTTITLGPLAIVGALGLAGSLQVQSVRHLAEHMPFISSFIFELLPLALLWLVFALLYQLVPNTKVNFTSALVGGIVAGSLWHLNNMFGFLYVSRVVSNSKIYGSLGLVPVFMIGLYFSWAILLLGAQVAYAFQNRAAYLQEKTVENVNQRGREFIALRLMVCIGRHFQNGNPPVSLQEISRELAVPAKLTLKILQTLLAAGLIVEVAGNEIRYSPARPLETINAHDVLLAMRTGGKPESVANNEFSRAEFFGEFAKIEQAERVAAASVTIQTLVNRPIARLEITESSETGKLQSS